MSSKTDKAAGNEDQGPGTKDIGPQENEARRAPESDKRQGVRGLVKGIRLLTEMDSRLNHRDIMLDVDKLTKPGGAAGNA